MNDSLTKKERESAKQLGLTEKVYLLLKKEGKLQALNTADLLTSMQSQDREERIQKRRKIFWDLFITLILLTLFLGITHSPSQRSPLVVTGILIGMYFVARVLRQKLMEFIDSKNT